MAPSPMQVALQCPACGVEVGLDVANCGVCGAAVGPQCPRCARQCRTGDLFCALCGARVVGEDEEALIHVRRAERKLVSIVFIDMVGFTSLGHQFDAEIVKEAMTAFFRRLAAVAREHGGYVEKFIGDAMMTVFGVPNAREDDAVRALEAALDMHAALAEVNAVWSKRLQREIQIRVGVNTGIAIAGAIGEGRATDYGVSGDVVNVAARFQGAADPAQTIVGETTRELGGRGFLYVPSPPLVLKGKPEPVPAFRLLGRAEAVTEMFGAVPLLGRDDELGQLRDVAALVEAGGTAAVALRGETGTGKTRLLSALKSDPSLEGLRWLQPAVGEKPLSLVRDLAKSMTGDEGAARVAKRLLGADDEIAVGLVEWLTVGDGSAESAVGALEGTQRAELLGNLLVRMAGSASEEAPLAIVVDDAEGVDGASLALLGRLVGDPSGARALVVTTGNTVWEPPWPTVASLDLAPLDRSSMQRILVEALGEEEIPLAARDALVDAAEGNPLALSELVWAYRSTGELPKKRAGGVAGTILALVQSRIDAVDADAKRVLQVGAVLGSSFEPELVGWIVGNKMDVRGAVARLKRRSLVTEVGGEVRFAQAAVRAVAYEGMLLAERKRLHGQAAIALDAAGMDDPFLLAHHFALSGDDAAAVRALAQAGEAHLAAGDAQSALDQFGQAVARIGAAEELGGMKRALLLGRMADLRAILGDLDGATATFAEATEALPTGLERAELLRRRALVEHRRGDDDGALDALQSARDDVTMAEMEGNEPVESVFVALASLAAAAARIHLGGGRLEEANWEARQAIEMLSHLSAEPGTDMASRRPAADANWILAEVLLAGGEHPEEAAEHADSARVAYAALRDVAGGLRADLAIARARAATGGRGEARARIETAMALARRLGDSDAVAACARALDELGVVVL